jgi:hypothetical protein
VLACVTCGKDSTGYFCWTAKEPDGQYKYPVCSAACVPQTRNTDSRGFIPFGKVPPTFVGECRLETAETKEIDREVSGNWFTWLIKNTAGEVVERWRIPPHWIAPRVENGLSFYEVRPDDGHIVRLPTDEVETSLTPQCVLPEGWIFNSSVMTAEEIDAQVQQGIDEFKEANPFYTNFKTP